MCVTLLCMLYFRGLNCPKFAGGIEKFYADGPMTNLGRRPPQYAPAPCDLDLWPFDLESVSESRVTCLPLCQV